MPGEGHRPLRRLHCLDLLDGLADTGGTVTILDLHVRQMHGALDCHQAVVPGIFGV